MNSPVGTIVSIADGHATVSVDAAAICARCAAGKGCGAGLLAGSNRSRFVDVPLTAGMQFKAGDEVRLSLEPSHLLRAAIFAYGLPLGGVILALGIAGYLNQSLDDRFAVVLAVAGLVAGVLFGRHLLSKDACLRNLALTITTRNA